MNGWQRRCKKMHHGKSYGWNPDNGSEEEMVDMPGQDKSVSVVTTENEVDFCDALPIIKAEDGGASGAKV